MKLKEAQSLIYGGEKCYPSYPAVAPCEAACPIGMKVPDYITAIGKEKLDEAYWVMRNSSPFVALCAYVCHHPCEAVCSRGKLDDPLAIRSLKRFVVDYALDKGLDSPAPFEPFRTEKVAVIGSGPAGLSAAYELIRKGYRVTVFDSQSRPGGMMRMGIPEFILPRKVLDAQISYIESSGVEFKMGVTIGKDESLEGLFEQGFQAIFIGIGTQDTLPLKLPGAEAAGVYYALPLIQDVNMGRRVEMGEKVVVIGGGNAAVQAARISIRLGAKDVGVVCLEDKRKMPAFAWEIQEAEEEGVTIHGSLAPLEILTEGDLVSEVRFGTVADLQKDITGKVQFRISYQEEVVSFSANTILIAIGQVPMLDGYEGLDLTSHGTIEVDPISFATNLDGVFSGGDAVKNPGTVVDALAAGKQAAFSIDQYLRGLPFETPQIKQVVEISDAQLPKFVEKRQRVVTPNLNWSNRIKSFDLRQMPLSAEDVLYEAKRCLNCSMCGHCLFEHSQICYQTASRLI